MIGVKKYIFIFFIFFSYIGISKTNLNYSAVKNGVEQINFLENFNKEKGIVSQKWYVYFLEEDLEYLKNVIANVDNEYKNIHVDNSVVTEHLYLKNLNDKLIEINKRNDLDVYVAFTGSENKISIPVIPKDKKTISSKISYLDSLVRYGSLSPNEKNNLLDSKNSLELYTKELKTVIKRIYEGSDLVSRSSAQNIIMPFSNLTIRSVYTSEGIKQKKFWSYSLHLAKVNERFNKLHFKKVYNSSEVKNKAFGRTKHLQSVSRQVLGIEMYFDNEVPAIEDSEKEECLALLEDPRYKPLLQARILSPAIYENPCILKNMGRMGPIDMTKSQWMQDTEFMIAAPLYCAILAPFAVEFLVPVAVESFGTERLTNSAVAMTAAVAIETVMLYAFTGTPTQKGNFTESLLGVNKINVVYEGVKALAKIPFAHELVLDCAFNGTDASKAISDFENYKLEWESKKCLLGVGITILAKVGLNQGGAYFKTLVDIAKKEPQVFVNGWSTLLKEIGPGQREAVLKLIEEVFQGTGIKPSKLKDYINQIKKGTDDIADNIDNTADDIGGNIDNTADDVVEAVDGALDNADNTAGDVIEAVDGAISKLKQFDGVSDDLVNSLSNKISLDELDKVVEIISKQSDDFPINSFLDDLSKGSVGFKNKIINNSEWIDAWETIIGNPMIRKDIKALESVSKIIDNTNLASVINKTDLSNIVNKLAQKGVKCRTCTGGNSAYKYLDEILDDIEFGAVKYGDEYTSVLIGFKQGGNFAEGAMFVASSLKKYPNDFPMGTVFEFTEVTIGGVRRVDVRVNNTFFEFKSVTLTNGMPPTGFANQFIKDLQLTDVNDLSQIKWWFDASKTSSISKADFLNALENAPITPDALNTIINKFSPNGSWDDVVDLIDNDFNQIFNLK